MGQVFARIVGFGLTVVPVWPYRIELVPSDPGALQVIHFDEGKRRTVVVRGGRDKPVADLGEGVDQLDEVAQVLRGPDAREWRIETPMYSVSWPELFAVEPPADDGGSIFDLHGPEGALIWLRGPFDRADLPAVEDLAAPGQTLTGAASQDGVEAVELAYEHEGAAWNQRHYLVLFSGTRILAVTAQAPESQVDLFRRASAEVAASVRPIE